MIIDEKNTDFQRPTGLKLGLCVGIQQFIETRMK